MSSKTGIEWTDSTWSPIQSEYPRKMRPVFVDTKVLLEPLKWKPMLTPVGQGGSIQEVRPRPRRIFVENQSDLFREWVTDEMLDRVFAVMALCPQHVFQVLTKRPERMLAYFAKPAGFGFTWCEGYALFRTRTSTNWPLPNVWLGVSVENQKAADERVPLLLETPAAVRFISAEPLIGPVDLHLPRQSEYPRKMRPVDPGLDWVICGGESGLFARAMNPDWARSLRDQCVDAAVPFFFKQWGEWGPLAKGAGVGLDQRKNLHPWGAGASFRFGKKAAGSLLDGREWKQFPEVQCNA